MKDNVKFVKSISQCFLILLAVSLISGCQLLRDSEPKPTFTPLPPPASINMSESSSQANDSELQTAAQQLTDKMLGSQTVQQLTTGKQPVLYVDTLKNNTSEYIDLPMIKETMTQRVTQTSRFRVIEPSKLERLRRDFNLSNTDELASSAASIKFVNQSGAEYMLSGKLVTQTDNNATVYKMTMQLMALDTGAIEWNDNQAISKEAIKSSGW